MKVRHIKSGNEEVITKEQWETIVANGFQSDFQVLEGHKPPAEVAQAIKTKAEPETKSV